MYDSGMEIAAEVDDSPVARLRALETELTEVCGHLNLLHARMVQLVADALETALAGEALMSYVVHHEATFDRDSRLAEITVPEGGAEGVIVANAEQLAIVTARAQVVDGDGRGVPMVLVLTTFDDDDDVYGALLAGAASRVVPGEVLHP